MSKIFCERVREIIQLRGRTVQEIADAINMDRQMVLRLKNGPTYDPKLSTVLRLADDLGVPLPWLLGRDNEVKVQYIEKVKVVKELVEVPVVQIKEVRHKFFNEKWEE